LIASYDFVLSSSVEICDNFFCILSLEYGSKWPAFSSYLLIVEEELAFGGVFEAGGVLTAAISYDFGGV